jgi:transposase
MICCAFRVVYQQTRALGWRQAALRLSLMICACSCVKRRDASGSHRQSSSIVGPCNRRQISGGRAGYDGAKRRKGSKVHAAVDTLGNLLALLVTPANEQDRAQVGELAQAVQEVTGQTVELAFVDQAYTGDASAEAANEHGIQLEVVKLPQAKRGFVLLPRRWVVERSFTWTTRGSRAWSVIMSVGRRPWRVFTCWRLWS